MIGLKKTIVKPVELIKTEQQVNITHATKTNYIIYLYQFPLLRVVLKHQHTFKRVHKVQLSKGSNFHETSNRDVTTKEIRHLLLRPLLDRFP